MTDMQSNKAGGRESRVPSILEKAICAIRSN
jgi:hypothetical protein